MNHCVGEGEGEEQKIPPPPIPGYKFFINNINSYLGRVLYQELENSEQIQDPIEKHQFVGTETSSEPDPVPQGVESVIKNDLTRSFRKQILESDIVIYDLMSSNFQEVDHVIKTFKTHEFEHEKALILVSSVMSWANTPPKVKKVNEDGEDEGDEEEEEPQEEDPSDAEEEAEGEEDQEEEPGEDDPPKPVVLTFKEKDFHLRVPSKRFQYLKTLETLALSSVRAQPKLRVYVLWAGVLYGDGERILHDHFKQSWLQDPKKLPFVGEGKNLVPTIHVRDLARLVRKIVYNRPESYYVFALDKTKNPTQKRLVNSIAKGMGAKETVSVAYDDVKKQEWAEFLTLDLKMRASDVLKDDEPPEDAENPEELAEQLKFPWHWKKGILKNVLMLNNEFNDYRKLKPVKILITGPPASGKSHCAKILAKYYNIPHITIQSALDLIPKLKGDFAEQVTTFIDEKKDAVVEEFESREDRKEDETLNRDEIMVRLPDRFLYKLMKMKLSENACRNRGYILDGYPRSHTDAQYVFLKRVFKETTNEDGDVEVEEADENDEIEEDALDDEGVLIQKDFSKYEPDVHLIPDSIIQLDGPLEAIRLRLMNLSEDKIENTHWNNDGLIRRTKVYREVNNSPIGDPSLLDFFTKWSIAMMDSNWMDELEKLIESYKIFIERRGKPNNYMTFDEVDEKARLEQFEKENKERQQMVADTATREEYIETQWRKQKEDYTKNRFEHFKEQERDLLDSKSQPIRAYLVDNVVGILSEGLSEVCKNQPEDPVDFLAEFLFRESRNVQPNNINFY